MSATVTVFSAPAPVIGKRSRDAGHLLDPLKRHRSDSNGSVSSQASAASFLRSEEDQEEDEDTASTPTTPLTPSARPKNNYCPHPGCSKAFDRPARLADHVRSHTQERPFTCSEEHCDKSFMRQSHLSHHIKSAHSTVREYACDWTGCDKRFATATRLRRHRDVHEGGQKYRCAAEGCDRVFRKHATLQRHVDADHLGQKPYRCSYPDPTSAQPCTEGFDNAAQLRAHERKTHAPPSHLCTLCPIVAPNHSPPAFCTFFDLQAHIRTVHPPTCPHCSRICTSTRDLARHLHITHADPTIVSPPPAPRLHCPDPACDKVFTKRGNLNVHVRSVHAREKPFVCGETDISTAPALAGWTGQGACAARFTAKASLEQHVVRRHLGAPPAPRAPRIPLTASTTLVHLTGAGYGEEDGRNIVCVDPTCTFVFARYYDMAVHARTAHGLEEWEVEDEIAERVAVSGGRFWVGGLDEEEEYVGAERGLFGEEEEEEEEEEDEEDVEALIAAGGLDDEMHGDWKE